MAYQLKASISSRFKCIIIIKFRDIYSDDFKNLLGLVENPDCITIAGDFSQAVHLGKKAQQLMAGIGRALDLDMKQWQHRTLDGSYRLPYRISNCLEPFSKSLVNSNSGNVLHSYPGGPPGARPILVFGETIEQCGCKIAQAMYYFRQYALRETRVTILEKDASLEKAIRSGWKNVIAKRDPKKVDTEQGLFFLGTQRDSVLRIKGLEMPFVVWSSMKNPQEGNLLETLEFSYTAMTRTSSILFIAVTNQTTKENLQAIRLLKTAFIMTWDIESKLYLKSLK